MEFENDVVVRRSEHFAIEFQKVIIWNSTIKLLKIERNRTKQARVTFHVAGKTFSLQHQSIDTNAPLTSHYLRVQNSFPLFP